MPWLVRSGIFGWDAPWYSHSSVSLLMRVRGVFMLARRLRFFRLCCLAGFGGSSRVVWYVWVGGVLNGDLCREVFRGESKTCWESGMFSSGFDVRRSILYVPGGSLYWDMSMYVITHSQRPHDP